jgi:hypothetical protein
MNKILLAECANPLKTNKENKMAIDYSLNEEIRYYLTISKAVTIH